MSEKTLETVRDATEAMLRGDAAAALDALDPEIEWHATVGGVDEGRIYKGREEAGPSIRGLLRGLGADRIAGGRLHRRRR